MYVRTSIHLTSKLVHYNDWVRLSDISTRSIRRSYNGEILVVLFLTVKPGDEARLSVLWSLCKAVTSLLQPLSSSSKWQNLISIHHNNVCPIKATTTLLQPLILFLTRISCQKKKKKKFIQFQTRGCWLDWCIHSIQFTCTCICSPCAAVRILSNDDACDACIMCMVVDMETAEWRGVVNWHWRGFVNDELLVESSGIDLVTGIS